MLISKNMICFNKLWESVKSKKFFLTISLCFASYFIIRFPYFTIDVFNYDEIWHSGYMNSGFHNQTKLYQAFSPLYWILGHIFLKSFGYADLAFGRTILRLFIASMYLASIFVLYKAAKVRNKCSSATILLVIVLILSAPISFFGGKAITPEYIQLFMFSVCLYFLSDATKGEEKKSIWFLAGISAGLKMHSLAVLPFLFLFRIVASSDDFSLRSILKRFFHICKIAIPFALIGLILANFPFLIYFDETRQSLKAVGNNDFNILTRIGGLFNLSQDPQCWESICPFYVRDSHSRLLYNLIAPLSLGFVALAFVIAANKAKNIAISILTIFCAFVIQVFIATGYANYPWYHLTYFPLLLSMLLYLDVSDFSQLRKGLLYFSILAAIIANLSTTKYLIKTDYSFRRDVASLIRDSAKNTACIDETISNEKPDAYIFSVISLFSGNGNSFIDSDFLQSRHFNSRKEMFNQSGYLNPSAIEILAKKKQIKLLFSIDQVSEKYNATSYNYQKLINKTKSSVEKKLHESFEKNKVNSEIEILQPCFGIKNYALKININ